MFRACHLVTAVLALALSACHQPAVDDGRAASSRGFPRPDRAVSKTGGGTFASEVQRDKVNEANVVMDLAKIVPGMSVADLGAGEGYYTTRLAQRVGKRGRVLAEDIDRGATERLGARVMREGIGNVSITLGAVDDPRLPPASFDRIFLVHMYHEVSEPYAFLWRMRSGLRPGGRVIVVDVDRPTDAHGIAPSLLFCEFASVGLRLTEFVRKPELQGYYAQFEAVGSRPPATQIKPCRMSGEAPPKTDGLQG
ncbi:class I SAM-dependent methyltransferase [Novosphingobium sp. BL-52-GroH]|uniref:class I SAM-dependent methyltransferase n=1 Tax=Novosphingobium sp. BL-52-GroH TaxID=3349877 RepID=UPI00384C29C9